ncbi:MAG: hypothetical protein RBT71_11930 [Flavobacteriales bacterium]|jgi:hypothetical protein|nr:hypothetical protein [Flavobacteriales bacterium]
MPRSKMLATAIDALRWAVEEVRRLGRRLDREKGPGDLIDMLRLVCDERELTYDQIADQLGISRNNLETACRSSRSSASRARPAWCSSPCAGAWWSEPTGTAGTVRAPA